MINKYLKPKSLLLFMPFLLCGIHCAFLPFLSIVYPLSSILAKPSIMLLNILIIASLIYVIIDFLSHRNLIVLFYFLIGYIIMYLGEIIEHDITHHSLNFSGIILIIIGSYCRARISIRKR